MLTFILLLAVVVFAIRGERWAQLTILVLGACLLALFLLARWLWLYIAGA